MHLQVCQGDHRHALSSTIFNLIIIAPPRAEEDEPLEEQNGSQLIAEGSAISEGQGQIDGEGSVAGQSMQSFQTGGAVRPEVRTVFRGDPVEYMKR